MLLACLELAVWFGDVFKEAEDLALGDVCFVSELSCGEPSSYAFS